MSAIRCGTYAGYQRHGREGTPRCQDCRDAYNAYHRDLRRRNADAYTRDKVTRRVMRRLAKEYPRRFVELLIEELAKEDTDA